MFTVFFVRQNNSLKRNLNNDLGEKKREKLPHNGIRVKNDPLNKVLQSAERPVAIAAAKYLLGFTLLGLLGRGTDIGKVGNDFLGVFSFSGTRLATEYIECGNVTFCSLFYVSTGNYQNFKRSKV